MSIRRLLPNVDGLVSLAFLKPIAELVQNMVGSLDVIDVQTLRKLVDPGRLKLHCKIECFFSSVRQHNQLRPAVVRVRLKFQHSILHEIVDDPLNVLAIRSHVAGNP